MSLEERIAYAEQRIEEMLRNDPDNTAGIRYWVGYLDALKTFIRS